MAEPLNKILNDPFYIICDTCVYASDFRLGGEAWLKIGAILNTHKNAKLVLPMAIEMEVLKKLSDLGGESIDTLKRAVAGAHGRLIALPIDSKRLEQQLIDEVKQYPKRLERFVKGKLLRAPMPKPSVNHYFERAVGGKKPFKFSQQKGGYKKAVNGFRDAVIWESVKEVYAKHPRVTVVFYTTNTADFSDGKTGALHSDLQGEIDKLAEKAKAFFYVSDDRNLASFLNEVRKDADFIGAVKSKIEEFVDSHPDEVKDALISGDDDDSSMQEAEDLNDLEFTLASVEVQKFYEESAGVLLVEAMATFDIRSEFFIRKSDYSSSREVLDVVDGDWNDHVMLVSKEDSREVHMLAVIPLAGSYKGAKVKVEQISICGTQIDD